MGERIEEVCCSGVCETEGRVDGGGLGLPVQFSDWEETWVPQDERAECVRAGKGGGHLSPSLRTAPPHPSPSLHPSLPHRFYTRGRWQRTVGDMIHSNTYPLLLVNQETPVREPGPHDVNASYYYDCESGFE